MPDLIMLLAKPALKRVAYRTAVGRNRSEERPEEGRLARRDVSQIIDRAWRAYGELGPRTPREPGPGPTLMVRLAAVTASYHRALSAAGVDEDQATRLTSDAVWSIYGRSAAITRLLSRAAGRDPSRRMFACIDLFLRFPFTQPGYRYERSSPAPDTVMLDMARCPVADYFESQGMAKVCAATWCNQDFALAETWGARITRTGTLAEGRDRCDFCFKAIA